jgi:hypothetical protein
MSIADAVPTRLYKYRGFDARTIELLVDDMVFFANPADFNDPLDTSPSLEPDLEVADLEALLQELMTRRVSAGMRAAAASLKYKGPKTMEHIDRHTQREVRRLLDDIAYRATDPDYAQEAVPGPQVRLLARAVEAELLRQYDKGILSLGARFDCPLMWSHYGDQHRGVAIGYSIPETARAGLHQVQYGGSRLVKASDVRFMLAGDANARQRVDRDVLLRKAADWQYEKEWRLLGTRGPAESPLELEEVVFGMRCLPAVRHTVICALEGRGRNVAFYEMREAPGHFGLRREQLDLDDPEPSGRPRRSLTLSEEFGDVSGTDGAPGQ